VKRLQVSQIKSTTKDLSLSLYRKMYTTRSGRTIKKPELYTPVETVTDDYDEDEYDPEDPDGEDTDLIPSDSEEEESDDEDDSDADEDGNLEGFVAPDDEDEEEEDPDEDEEEEDDE